MHQIRRKSKTTDPVVLKRIDREKHLRLLWIGFFEKHFPIKGNLKKRFDTQAINFKAYIEGEPCTGCGVPFPRKSCFDTQTVCPECKHNLSQYHAASIGSKKHGKERHDRRLKEMGKLERIERKEKLSAGKLYWLFHPVESAGHWPPEGNLVLSAFNLNIPVHLMSFRLSMITAAQYSDIKEIYPDKTFDERVNTRIRRS